jgi:hypothetical protein
MSSVLEVHPAPWRRGETYPQAQAEIIDANDQQIAVLRKFPNQGVAIEAVTDVIVAAVNGAPIPAVVAPAAPTVETVSVVVADLASAPVVVNNTSQGNVLVVTALQLQALSKDELLALVGITPTPPEPEAPPVDAPPVVAPPGS